MMRIGFGKKIGGIYVGTSISGKKAVNGIAMLFLWPFYLSYYLFIWPIIAIIKAILKAVNKETAINNKARQVRIVEAQNYLRIIQDSSKICSNTKVPETFFSRLDLIFETTEKLKTYADVLNDEGNTILANISDIETAKVSTINEFIDKYAKETRLKIYNLTSKKAKENKANAFKNILSEYDDKMTEENIVYYTRIANEMMSIIE